MTEHIVECETVFGSWISFRAHLLRPPCVGLVLDGVIQIMQRRYWLSTDAAMFEKSKVSDMFSKVPGRVYSRDSAYRDAVVRLIKTIPDFLKHLDRSQSPSLQSSHPCSMDNPWYPESRLQNGHAMVKIIATIVQTAESIFRMYRQTFAVPVEQNRSVFNLGRCEHSH